MILLSVRRLIANTAVGLLPPSRCFLLKRLLWRFGGVNVGKSVRFVSSAKIWTSGRVVIGEGTFIGHQVLLVGGPADIEIGSFCDLGPRVTLATGTHKEDSNLKAAGTGVSHPIRIGDGVWLGAASTILNGVTIGHLSIVGAGSLVNKDIPDNVVAVGVPCLVKRKRKAAEGDFKLDA